MWPLVCACDDVHVCTLLSRRVRVFVYVHTCMRKKEDLGIGEGCYVAVLPAFNIMWDASFSLQNVVLRL